MGINTRTYILGAIVGVSVLFTLTMALQSATTEVSLYSYPTIKGHATILLTSEDGSTKYIQTDNQMHLACLSAMHDGAFGTPGSADNLFRTLQFYEGTGPPSSSGTPTLELANTELADVADITTSTTTSGVGKLAGYTTFFEFDTSTFGAADQSKFLRQIALTDGAVGEVVCASFVIGAPCTLQGCTLSTSTTAKVTWTISTTDT